MPFRFLTCACPLTASGTNLLGLVKHLAGLEAEYFGGCLGHPWPDHVLWNEDAGPNADMWATADESPEQIIDLYRRAQSWADATIADLPLDAPRRTCPGGSLRATTPHCTGLLVHMIAETARHAGHMDVLRETIDGQRGLLQNVSNLPDVDDAWWQQYVARLRRLAESLEPPLGDRPKGVGAGMPQEPARERVLWSGQKAGTRRAVRA